MPYISLDKSNDSSLLHYQEYGSGQPVVLIHGWPLSHRAWEPQMQAIADAGYRAIAYDRRGFGASYAPYEGYSYTELTKDLNSLITELDLNDVILVGFSMGGGEVVRYFTDYGTDRIAKAALISSIIPLVPQKDDNPDGVPQKELDGILESVENDRVTFLGDFVKNFFHSKALIGTNSNDISEQNLQYAWSIAAEASPRATVETAKSWASTDFRSECKNVTVPTLIVHGDGDQVVPIETAGKQAAELIPNNTYHVIDGGPHGLNLTHKDELNKILIDFFKS